MKAVNRHVWIVLAFVVGMAAGWFVGGFGERGMGDEEWGTGNGERTGGASYAAKTKRKAEDRSVADKAELAALRRRMEELERELAAVVAPKPPDAKDYSKLAFQIGDSRYDGSVTLGDIRKDDPKRHGEIVDWLKENKSKNFKAQEKFDEWLCKFDLSRLPDEMRAVHEKYMERYSKYIRMWDRIDPENDALCMGELSAFNSENWDRGLEMGFLAKEEEAALKWLAVEKHARELGYSDADAAVIAYALRDLDYISRVMF